MPARLLLLLVVLVACGGAEDGSSPDSVRTCYGAGYESIPVGTVVTEPPC